MAHVLSAESDSGATLHINGSFTGVICVCSTVFAAKFLVVRDVQLCLQVAASMFIFLGKEASVFLNCYYML